MVESYVYSPLLWMDDIIELDESNLPIPERDEDGNIVYETGQFGNLILHPIKKEPIPKYKRLQRGTRHSAENENNQEEGITMSHLRLDGHDNDIMRMRIQLELNDKSPGNSGTFADTFDGEPNKLIRLNATADITQAVNAGSIVLPVDKVTGFAAFTQVTIYDGTNTEDVLITAVGVDTITVQALTHDYVKGARIARSNAKIDGQMMNGNWGTYSVSMMEVV